MRLAANTSDLASTHALAYRLASHQPCPSSPTPIWRSRSHACPCRWGHFSHTPCSLLTVMWPMLWIYQKAESLYMCSYHVEGRCCSIVCTITNAWCIYMLVYVWTRHMTRYMNISVALCKKYSHWLLEQHFIQMTVIVQHLQHHDSALHFMKTILSQAMNRVISLLKGDTWGAPATQYMSQKGIHAKDVSRTCLCTEKQHSMIALTTSVSSEARCCNWSNTAVPNVTMFWLGQWVDHMMYRLNEQQCWPMVDIGDVQCKHMRT